MIVAMSRFRVENSREQDVRQAFLDRPGFVDNQAGFMGLEVFQDRFRTWHSGHAHRRSHEAMPKGLKLDSAFTELRILERVEDDRGGQVWEHFTGDWEALTRAYLASSTTVHGVVANADGVILGATAAMERLLGGESGRLNGQPLWKFLTPESAKELRIRVDAGSRQSALRFPVTFIGADCAGRVLGCNLDVQPDAFALLGEELHTPEGGSRK